jgi:uncharacterized membrane protein
MASFPDPSPHNDAPATAAVAQHDLAEQTADELDWRHAAVVGRTVTINLPRSEVYSFWRDFTNLGRVMENIESVTVRDDGRSHWVVKAPGGRTVEWDSVITEDEPDRLIAWSSVEGAEIRNVGRIEFRDAPPGRGAEVTAEIAYEPPAGDVGMLIAKLFQKEPKVQARRELRRLKQYLETGEISTAKAPDAAPRA